MEIIGTIQQILSEQTGESSKGSWKKQDFIIETLDKYPRKVCLTNWQGKITLEEYRRGDLIKALLNVESNEYNGKWYTDLKVWKMEKIQKNQTTEKQKHKAIDDVEHEDGDLPF